LARHFPAFLSLRVKRPKVCISHIDMDTGIE
jgi:hypothetical protein